MSSLSIIKMTIFYFTNYECTTLSIHKKKTLSLYIIMLQVIRDKVNILIDEVEI